LLDGGAIPKIAAQIVHEIAQELAVVEELVPPPRIARIGRSPSCQVGQPPTGSLVGSSQQARCLLNEDGSIRGHESRRHWDLQQVSSVLLEHAAHDASVVLE